MTRILHCAPIFALCAAATGMQPCTPYWLAMPKAFGGVTPYITFDDGSGVALYAKARLPTWQTSAAQRWRGHEWELLSQGLPSDVRNVHPPMILDDGSGPRMFLLALRSGWTSFVWTGQEWVPGPPGFVLHDQYQMILSAPWFSYDHGAGPVIYGGRLIASPLRAVTRWNGTSWDDVFMYEGTINSWVEYDDGTGPAVYLSGSFTDIAGTGIRHFARWDGTTFSPVGTHSFNTGCSEMVILEEPGGAALYCLNCSNPNSPECIRRWDGQNWSLIPGPAVPGGLVATVRDMIVFDDGSGPALYLGGSFPVIGGFEARGIAKWDGQSWHPVGNGIRGEVIQFGIFNEDPRGPSLLAFGPTGTRPGEAPSRLLQLVGCPNCYANCDNSTTEPILTVDDFTCFINNFALQSPYANCNQDGIIDIDDFVCFISKFALGCP